MAAHIKLVAGRIELGVRIARYEKGDDEVDAKELDEKHSNVHERGVSLKLPQKDGVLLVREGCDAHDAGPSAIREDALADEADASIDEVSGGRRLGDSMPQEPLPERVPEVP